MTALIGDIVEFQRGPTHHPELARVCAKLFGAHTGTVEVIDADGVRHTLSAGSYTVKGRDDERT